MTTDSVQIELPAPRERRAHDPWSDLALHTIGWRAFQDLYSQVCEVGPWKSAARPRTAATLLEHRHRFPDVETHLIYESSDHLVSDLASSVIDIAFVAEANPSWSNRSLLLRNDVSSRLFLQIIR